MKLKKFFFSQIKKSPSRTAGLFGVLLILLTTVCAIFVGRTLDHVTTVAAFDKFVYEAINLGPHPAWLNALVNPFNFNFLPWGGTFIPSFLFFVIGLTLLYIFIFNRKNFAWAVGAFLLALLIDTVLFKITNAYVIRPRPFVHLTNNLSASAKAIWANWPTYPSGHVRDLVLYATVLSGYAKKLMIPFVVLTVWVGYTRVYLGAHYPTDVLAAVIIGYCVGLGILLIVQSVQKARQKTPRLKGRKPSLK